MALGDKGRAGAGGAFGYYDTRDGLNDYNPASTLWVNDSIATPGGYEVYRPFRDFLSSPAPAGCLVTMERPAGETYEFYFDFLGERYYGKILLCTDRKRLCIFSAHRPRKPKLSCE